MKFVFHLKLDNAGGIDTEETDNFGRTAMAAAFWSGKEARYYF